MRRWNVPVKFLIRRFSTSFPKRSQTFGVLHEVGGGGGAHFSQALQQAEDEEDQAFVGGAYVSGLEGSVFQAAAQVERGRFQGAAEVGGEGGLGPDGAGG